MTVSLPSRRMSKSSLFSLICGILVCVPFVAGALALLFGIIGFFKTRGAHVTGRWMAIVGSLLGVGSILFWSFLGTAFLALFFATAAPRAVAGDYLSAVARGDDAAAAELCTDATTPAEAAEFSQSVRQNGALVGASFTDVVIKNNLAGVSGTATFANGTHPVKATLTREKGKWKVMNMGVGPLQ